MNTTAFEHLSLEELPTEAHRIAQSSLTDSEIISRSKSRSGAFFNTRLLYAQASVIRAELDRIHGSFGG